MKTDSFDSAPHYHYASLDSTNNYASKLAKLPETRNGTAISADFQSEGRGQRGTTWEAPAQQGYLVSFILFPSLQASEIFYLSKFVAVSLADSLNKFGVQQVQIKWPNDIYIQNRKLAGILIENSWGENELQHSIAGIGLNVLPISSNQFNSVSLSEALPHVPSLSEYVSVLQQTFFANWPLIALKQFQQIDERYHASLFKLHEQATFLTASNQEIIGKISHVAPDGALTIQDDQGQSHSFYLKEIKLA